MTEKTASFLITEVDHDELVGAWDVNQATHLDEHHHHRNGEHSILIDRSALSTGFAGKVHITCREPGVLFLSRKCYSSSVILAIIECHGKPYPLAR